jgi:N utilization substance protein B
MVIKRPDPDKVILKPMLREAEKRELKGNKGSAKARRTAARLAAVQVLYQMGLNNQGAAEAVEEFISHRVGFNLDGDVFVPADADLLRDIVNGVQERWLDIEQVRAAALAEGGRTDVEAILEAILRAGIFELIGQPQTDAGIIISDYLSVTAGFYEGGETKLVNAILDNIAKKVRV